MRSGTRQHTTLSGCSKGIAVSLGIRIAFLLSLVLAVCFIGTTQVEAQTVSDSEVWQWEIVIGADLDGDGIIGPPPERDPPIGGPVI